MQTVRRCGPWMDLVGVLLVLAVLALGCSRSPQSSEEASIVPALSSSLAITSAGTAPRPTPDGPEETHPLVEIRTTMGTIQLKLDAEHAPETVQNFMSYVVSGHYNGTIFHQVDKGYALLGGGYTPELSERQGRYSIHNEAANGLKNRRGTIAMARRMDDVNSATCQFIINLDDNSGLDHQGDTPETYGFCVFGEVVEGLDVVERIAAVPVHDTETFTKLPTHTVVIQSVRRLH